MWAAERDTEKETVERVIRRACDELLLPSVSMERVASIDLKKDEAGIIGYCQDRNLPFVTYTKEELAQVKAPLRSQFVEEVTGVDNVCERSAVLGSSQDGVKSMLILRKYAEDGVTVALARRKWSVHFE